MKRRRCIKYENYEKIVLIVGFVIIVNIFGCNSKSSDILDDVAVLTVDDKEHVLSRKDSDILREYLDISSDWEKCEGCDCTVNYELVLDGVLYKMGNREDNHPIHYCEPDGTVKKAMENEDDEAVKKVYRILERWYNMGDTYEYFMMQNRTPSDSAILSINNDASDVEYTIGKDDTNRLRELLDAEAGWTDILGCECLGEYEIVLDNVRYVIETDEIKYGMAGKSASYAISGPDEIMQEIFQIIERTLP